MFGPSMLLHGRFRYDFFDGMTEMSCIWLRLVAVSVPHSLSGPRRSWLFEDGYSKADRFAGGRFHYFGFCSHYLTTILPTLCPISKQIRGYFRKVSQRLQDRASAGEPEEGGHDGTEGESAEDRRTKHLTARVGEEVKALQQILYHFPKTPGGVPDAFLDIRGGGSVATLEKDGVEEDHDRNRSARPKDPVVVTIED